MKLVYTDDAIEDLRRLREFIFAHNPTAASRVAAEPINMLPEFPGMGAPVLLAPAPETIRDMVFGRHIVRYSVHAEVIVVLRLWHELEGER